MSQVKYIEELPTVVKTDSAKRGCGGSMLTTQLKGKWLTWLTLKYEKPRRGGRINELLFGDQETAPENIIESLLTPQRAKELRTNEERNKRSFELVSSATL